LYSNPTILFIVVLVIETTPVHIHDHLQDAQENGG